MLCAIYMYAYINIHICMNIRCMHMHDVHDERGVWKCIHNVHNICTLNHTRVEDTRCLCCCCCRRQQQLRKPPQTHRRPQPRATTPPRLSSVRCSTAHLSPVPSPLPRQPFLSLVLFIPRKTLVNPTATTPAATAAAVATMATV